MKLKQTKYGHNQQVLGTNDAVVDAWGRQKVILDHSLFHGMWLFDIPKKLWIESHATGGDITTLTEQTTFTKTVSEDGMLKISAGNTLGDIGCCKSRRHPKYQPNRGHLYSTSMIIDEPTLRGNGDFGLCTIENGIVFRFEGDGTEWKLLVVVKTLGVETEHDITSKLPPGFDPTKGHVYDIQMMWRGVGNFMIYIDLELIHVVDNLGKLTGLSIANPALPATFRCLNNGDNYYMRSGCVDISSEGGSKANRIYASGTTGDVLLNTVSGNVVAMLATSIPELVNGLTFTLDSVLTRVTTFCKDEAIHGVYISRGVVATNTKAVMDAGSTMPQSFNKLVAGGNGSALNDAFQLDIASFIPIYAARQEKDFAKETISPANTDNFILSSGDILVVTLRSDGNSKGGATIEVSEEL